VTGIAAIALKLLFALFTAFAVLGAIVAVFSSRVLRGVSGLAICSVGLSGFYYFLGSPFIALMEILIYIGAVCVTIVFAIMLAEPEETLAEERRDEHRPGGIWWTALGLLASLGVFVDVWLLGVRHHWIAPAGPVKDDSVAALGLAFLTRYSLAFEVISLVLLVAILGALAIARGGRRTAQ
jgi:NADH:ubiquinone oxidoreductase subunit 6 (subunit J)